VSSTRGTVVLAELAPIRADLEARGLLTGDPLAVVCVGSVARGWANPGSDVDLNVVTADPAELPQLQGLQVRLEPDVVPTLSTLALERPCELKYWTTGQIDQLLGQVSWDRFDAGGGTAKFLGDTEELCLERFATCVPLAGEEWVASTRRRLEESAFAAFATVRSLAGLDAAVEDALGQLAAGDAESAVLSARRALGHGVDALLESHGVFGSAQPKWRARRFRDAAPSELSFAEYWDLETMRDLDPARPGGWVERVVALCRRLSMEVEIG
jgi:hypothetical protein